MENEIMKVNLIKEIKLRRWLKASFYDTANFGVYFVIGYNLMANY